MIKKLYSIIFRPHNSELAGISHRGLVFIIWNLLFAYLKFKIHFSRVSGLVLQFIIFYYFFLGMILLFCYESFGPDLEFEEWVIQFPAFLFAGDGVITVIAKVFFGIIFIILMAAFYARIIYAIVSVPHVMLILFIHSVESIQVNSGGKPVRLIDNKFALHLAVITAIQYAVFDFTINWFVVLASALAYSLIKTYATYLAHYFHTAAKKEIYIGWVLVITLFFLQTATTSFETVLQYLIGLPFLCFFFLSVIIIYPIGTLSPKPEGFDDFKLTAPLRAAMFTVFDNESADMVFGSFVFNWFTNISEKKLGTYKIIAAGVFTLSLLFSSVYSELDWVVLSAVLAGIYFWGLCIDRGYKWISRGLFGLFLIILTTNFVKVVIVSMLYGIGVMVFNFTAKAGVSAAKVATGSHAIRLMFKKIESAVNEYEYEEYF